jgi:two-component system sensor histidine kinase DesK
VTVTAESDRERRAQVARMRAGSGFGLLFLIGPIADLAAADDPPARSAAIVLSLAAFVGLYLALMPPLPLIARLGARGIRGGLALLAAIAGLMLVLGAPRSFSLLFVYVVAAAGVLLPSAAAGVVIGVTAAGVGAGLAASGADGATVAAHVLTILAVGALMAALGREARINRELRAAREELARLAVAEERLRIARDLHDLLGHTLSVIALKSELAAKLAGRDAERARAEMEDVQQVTRQALAEVREAVRGYRRLALGDALDGARRVLAAAGIDCRVEGSAGGLPAEVEDLLAWAVREAATNVVRHSGARACAITLSAGGDGVKLQVDDDGPAAPGGPGGGTGLAGLEERARRVHGTLEAGARPGGGYSLRLAVPFPAS